MSRRSRIVGFGSAALLVVAGVVCAAVIAPGLGEALALVLISLGLILAVSLVFLEFGLSEDRERAREAKLASRPARPTPARPTPARPTPARPTPARPTPARSAPARPARRRLDRMRGRPRRLR